MFKGTDGKLSNIRVQSFIMLWAGIVFLGVLSVCLIIGKPIDANSIFIFLICVTAAFAPKVIQKYAEKEISKQ